MPDMKSNSQTSMEEFLKEVAHEWENLTSQAQDLFCRLITGESKPIMVVNLEKFIRELLGKNRKTIANGMSLNELKAYDLAITNCMSAIESLFTGEDEVVVCRNDGRTMEEAFPEEIL